VLVVLVDSMQWFMFLLCGLFDVVLCMVCEVICGIIN